MTKMDNIKVFLDTQYLCKYKYKTECAALCRDTKFYADPTKLSVPHTEAKRNVQFCYGGSMSVAYNEAEPYCKVAVLDFASALKPGGCPECGAFTQEENMCRCSNLFVALEAHNEYFDYHKRGPKDIYTNGALYVPSVTMFKDDTDYTPVKEKQFDIIVCPAPSTHCDPARINNRAMGIVKLAAHRGVDVLILGAWGCGAFGQDPSVIGKAFALALNKYNHFSKVIFAVRPTVGSWGANNYEPLAQSFCKAYTQDVQVEV